MLQFVITLVGDVLTLHLFVLVMYNWRLMKVAFSVWCRFLTISSWLNLVHANMESLLTLSTKKLMFTI